MIPTKTDKTKYAYRKRAQNLLVRFENETNTVWNDDFNILINWLKSLRSGLKKASWRQYKASLVFYFLEMHIDENVVIAIKNIDPSACVKKSANTSANKMKKVTLEEMAELEAYLSTSSNKWDNLIIKWLDLSIITGLRPQEWEHVKLDRQVLIVKNAKNTNGRSFAASRLLDLTNIDPEDIFEIELFLSFLKKAMKEEGRNFEFVYNACRFRLRRVTRLLWPNRKKFPTLYSARHQFSANAKKIGFSKPEVAALMGHKSDATATEHYGKKKDGIRLPTFIVPDSEQVKMILSKQKKNMPHKYK